MLNLPERLTARARFSEGLPEELAAKVVEQFHNEHGELDAKSVGKPYITTVY